MGCSLFLYPHLSALLRGHVWFMNWSDLSPHFFPPPSDMKICFILRCWSILQCSSTLLMFLWFVDTVLFLPLHPTCPLHATACLFKKKKHLHFLVNKFYFVFCIMLEMVSSQPVNIVDSGKRNKKKRRTGALDSFTGRFEGLCIWVLIFDLQRWYCMPFGCSKMLLIMWKFE